MAQDSVTSTTTSTGADGRSAPNVSNGRGFQELNDAYKLPTDSDEHSRLDLQHGVVSLMLGGSIYQQPDLVRAALSPTETHKRRILDVGAGSGKWYDNSMYDDYEECSSTAIIFRAIEMAKEFCDAEVLGIDLRLPSVLADPSQRLPSNCSFQIADANYDMDKFDPVFDVVHQRCVEAGINDADLFFYEAARILRPDGVLLLVGANPVSRGPYSTGYTSPSRSNSGSNSSTAMALLFLSKSQGMLGKYVTVFWSERLLTNGSDTRSTNIW